MLTLLNEYLVITNEKLRFKLIKVHSAQESKNGGREFKQMTTDECLIGIRQWEANEVQISSVTDKILVENQYLFAYKS